MKTFLFILCFAPLLFGNAAFAEKIEVLIQEEAAKSYGATLPEGGGFDVLLQSSTVKEAVIVSAFYMDQNTGQFAANVATKEGQIKRVGGVAVLSVEVPVPLKRMLPNEIITASDITTERLPYSRVGSFAVMSAKEVIGKQVQRLLPKGRPIMTQSIMEPRIISRGDKVDIIYKDGPITLTAPGRALADAARGQEIKIVNLVGNTTLSGIASSEGIVEIIR